MLYENESFQLNPEKMPKHVAIIMDGNGRWATKRGLPRKAGHKAGAEALERIIYAAKELGLEHLTVYAFSTENWKRSAEEVGAIMDLLRFYLTFGCTSLAKRVAWTQIFKRRLQKLRIYPEKRTA